MTRNNKKSDPKTRSDVRIGSNKGKLRIQFSRAISQEIFGVRQKYFYPGLSDTPENLITAEGILEKIQNDIRANKLEKNLEVYSSVSELKEKVGIFYDPNRIDISTLELFNKYCIFKKPQIQETTYVAAYEGTYYNFLSSAPQNLNQQAELVEFLYNRCASHSFVTIVNLLYEMVTWAKKRDIVPTGASNRFKELKKDYKVVHRSRKVPQLLRKIQPGYHKDRDYTAFTRDEATSVINSFIEYAELKQTPVKGRILRDKDLYIRAGLRDIVQFCFYTGCRICEASGLRWLDVDEDYEFVYFRHGYSSKLKKITPLKTEHVGEEETKARKFTCGQKLAELLKSRKRLVYKGNDTDFVFPHAADTPHIPLNNNHLRYHWYGCENKQKSKNGDIHEMVYRGIVLQLAIDKKISQYLNPYATRHTWITLQLIEGVPIKNIAKLAGNTPEVILKNYASYVPDFNLAPEV